MSPTPQFPNTGRDGLAPVLTYGFRWVYSFGKSPGDAAAPQATLIDYNGTLYGTASAGGKFGDGAIFSITPQGIETVVHSFRGSDGKSPVAELLLNNGAFYGTTEHGGGSGLGVVFKITPSGNVKVLHNFSGQSDGAFPESGLANVNGTLYGTTFSGGSGSAGTVYRISASGAYRVLHAFSGVDGSNPTASLTAANGMLFGSTQYGGRFGNGTAFGMGLNGSVKVLHSFKGMDDGVQPRGRLLYTNKKLFGAASSGGLLSGGVIYSVTPAGKYANVANFRLSECHPVGDLIWFGNNLYGTTAGGTLCGGDGSIFLVGSIPAPKSLPNEGLMRPNALAVEMHLFLGGKGGSTPLGGLIYVGNRKELYGTTSAGGHYGEGMVYSIHPQPL